MVVLDLSPGLQAPKPRLLQGKLTSLEGPATRIQQAPWLKLTPSSTQGSRSLLPSPGIILE